MRSRRSRPDLWEFTARIYPGHSTLISFADHGQPDHLETSMTESTECDARFVFRLFYSSTEEDKRLFTYSRLSAKRLNPSGR